ncbi:hypothetical protein B0H19DRAFT_1066805 [Mycena capillaripes]|nr:hypothetical protein B0H19DRAFT_1066805 [Mycena capillaripes]
MKFSLGGFYNDVKPRIKDFEDAILSDEPMEKSKRTRIEAAPTVLVTGIKKVQNGKKSNRFAPYTDVARVKDSDGDSASTEALFKLTARPNSRFLLVHDHAAERQKNPKTPIQRVAHSIAPTTENTTSTLRITPPSSRYITPTPAFAPSLYQQRYIPSFEHAEQHRLASRKLMFYAAADAFLPGHEHGAPGEEKATEEAAYVPADGRRGILSSRRMFP